MRIKISPADLLFSHEIRGRDGWKCVRCKRQFTPPTNGLHCSHFWGRGNKKTRFDPRNCDALCYGCHSHWEGRVNGYEEFKREQLGPEQYADLERCARSNIHFGEYEFTQMKVQLAGHGLTGLTEYVAALH